MRVLTDGAELCSSKKKLTRCKCSALCSAITTTSRHFNRNFQEADSQRAVGVVAEKFYYY